MDSYRYAEHTIRSLSDKSRTESDVKNKTQQENWQKLQTAVKTS